MNTTSFVSSSSVDVPVMHGFHPGLTELPDGLTVAFLVVEHGVSIPAVDAIHAAVHPRDARSPVEHHPQLPHDPDGRVVASSG